MDPYFITVATLYALLIPLHLGLILCALYHIIVRFRNNKKNFGLTVYFMIIIYCIGKQFFHTSLNPAAKLLWGGFQLSSCLQERKIVILRALTAATDTCAVEFLITLLDIVVLSWARINSNVGSGNEKATEKIVLVIIIVKSVVVYSIILGYLIVNFGAWNPFLTFGIILLKFEI